MVRFRCASGYLYADWEKSEFQIPLSAIRRPRPPGLVFFFLEGADFRLIVCSELVQIDIGKIS